MEKRENQSGGSDSSIGNYRWFRRQRFRMRERGRWEKERGGDISMVLGIFVFRWGKELDEYYYGFCWRVRHTSIRHINDDTALSSYLWIYILRNTYADAYNAPANIFSETFFLKRTKNYYFHENEGGAKSRHFFKTLYWRVYFNASVNILYGF